MGSGFAEHFGVLFLVVFAAAFPIVNPAGSALIFLDMTRRADHRLREELARRIAFYSFLVLTVSLLIGSYVLSFFGISVPALRVAGGIVVAAAGWQFLQEHDEEEPVAPDAVQEQSSRDGFLAMAFFPFTMPITTGPGTISVMIALGTSHATHDPLQHRFLFDAAALAANATLAVVVYFCFAFADRVQRILGNTGTTTLLRLSAFILFCIGVQIFWSGVAEFLAPWRPH
ncbi:MAG TPA: MarC family NAAT transporter [Rhizomicrobium sp.]|nr:MarC family NAAT transporter [Rhizomicrobium sp.]